MEDDAAAGWIAEAFETGNPLAALPEPPADIAAGERIAAAVLDRLGLAPCGIRLGPGATGLAGRIGGPMLEGRLLAPKTPVLLAALRHARATAALLAVLAEDLAAVGDGLPAFATLHPAIDLAASRFTAAPTRDALLAADLGGLGQVVVGRGMAAPPLESLRAIPVSLALAGRRPRAVPVDLTAALAEATLAARRLGGLPAGAVLVIAGLTPAILPAPGMVLALDLGLFGRVRATLA